MLFLWMLVCAWMVFPLLISGIWWWKKCCILLETSEHREIGGAKRSTIKRRESSAQWKPKAPTPTPKRRDTVTEKLMNCLLCITWSQGQNLLTSKRNSTFLKAMKMWSRWSTEAEVRRWDTSPGPTELRWIGCLTESIWTQKVDEILWMLFCSWAKKRSDESVTWCWECAQRQTTSVVRQEKGSRRTCAKHQVRNSTDRHLRQVKTLITSAWLKHSDFLKNWQLDWNVSNCCCELSLTKTIETCEINTKIKIKYVDTKKPTRRHVDQK